MEQDSIVVNIDMQSVDISSKYTENDEQSHTKVEVKKLTDSFRNNIFSTLPDNTKSLKSSKLVADEKQHRLTSRVKNGREYIPLEKIEMDTINNGKSKIAEINADTQGQHIIVEGKGVSSMTEHTLSLQALAEKLQINPVDIHNPQSNIGLSDAQALQRLDIYGKNEGETSRGSKLSFTAFIECLTNLFNVLLFASGIIYLILYAIDGLNDFESIWVGSTLIAAGLVNTCIEFYEISKIATVLDAFQKLVISNVMVIRDSGRKLVESSSLVPGDIIFVKSGDRLPADAILFHANDLIIDGSNLTGENEHFNRVPVPKGSLPGTDPFDCPQVLLSTDIVSSGEGYAIVVQTGENSVAGKIRKLTSRVKPRKSLLSLEISRFCKSMVILALLSFMIFFIWALARGRNLTYAITFGVGILIGWIPQGLPFTVTMLLSISGRRMSDLKVLVKDLRSIETLGAITMLATDKTGTLTRNDMTVTDVWLNDSFWTTDSSVNASIDEMISPKPLVLDISGVAQLLHVCVTCSKARYENLGSVVVIGDSTEVGLLKFASKRLKNVDQINNLYPKVMEIPFSSESKWHLTIHRKSHSNGGLTLHVKGAPEKIWSMCSTYWINGKILPICDAVKRSFDSAMHVYARQGKRVIACAILQLKGEKYPDNYKFDVEKGNFPKSQYTLLGLIAMDDSPKERVAETIEIMKTAGIKVLMVTGDNHITAEAISRKVNIITTSTLQIIQSEESLPVKFDYECEQKQGIVISGDIVDRLSCDDWFQIFNHSEILFARVLPHHKLEIVRRAQSLGHIVGVTGDGVNDSAALKQADLGIAMNNTGSDVSKDCARMILLDDNFNTTLKGIHEGRLIFTNLKKAIKYSLSHIMAEILPYLLYVVVPIPLPITPTQILVIDLGFELLMTLSFAWEPAENDNVLLSIPPRRQVTLESAKQAHRHFVDSLSKNEAVVSLNNLQDTYTDSTELLTTQNDIQGDLKQLNSRVQNRYAAYINEAKLLTKKNFWESYFKEWREITLSSGGERLLDREVLLWAYIEAGLLEVAACLCTYFAIFWFQFGVSADAARNGQIDGNVYWKPHSPPLPLGNGLELSGSLQFEALKQVQSGFYLSIFVMQLFNYFACKHRYSLVMSNSNWMNHRMWVLVGSAGFLAAIIVYTPITNAIFLTSLNLDPVCLLIPISFGITLYFYSVFRFTLLSIFVRATS